MFKGCGRNVVFDLELSKATRCSNNEKNVTSVHPETGIFAGKVVFASNLQGARHASFVKISSKVARIHDE